MLPCHKIFLIADVCGGMSQVMSALLKMVLHNELCYVQDSGIVLKNSTSQLKLFFKLGFFLQHGLAQKTIWSLKGDSGTRFCLYCQNLVTSRSGIEGEVLTSNSFDLASILQSSDKSLQRTIATIAANHATMSHDDFALWQQATGFNFCKQSLPWDPLLGSSLLPREMFTHDWMHTFFVTGVFNIMTQLVMPTKWLSHALKLGFCLVTSQMFPTCFHRSTGGQTNKQVYSSVQLVRP